MFDRDPFKGICFLVRHGLELERLGYHYVMFVRDPLEDICFLFGMG